MEGNLSLEEKKKIAKKRLKKTKNKILIMSGKGGVGKTTVAVNLATALQICGYKTGILDADIHGPNIPKMLGIEKKQPKTKDGIIPAEAKLVKGLKVISLAFFLQKDAPVIWRSPMKNAAIQQFLYDVEWGELDYLIFDLPPGTGDEPLTIKQTIDEVTGSIIVTTPQDLALLDSRRTIEFSKGLGIPVLGVIENMSGFTCPHCKKKINLFKAGGGKQAAKELGVRFLGSIPLDQKIMEDCDSGRPFIIKHKKSDSSKAFNKIVDKIIELTK